MQTHLLEASFKVHTLISPGYEHMSPEFSRKRNYKRIQKKKILISYDRNYFFNSLTPLGLAKPYPWGWEYPKSPSPSHEIASSVPLHTCFLAKSSARKKYSERIKKIPFFFLCQMIFLDTWGNELVIEQKAGVVKKMHFFISLYPVTFISLLS